LSYPMFTGLYALVIGLIGAVWRLAVAEAPAAVRADNGTPAPELVSTRTLLPAGG
jgi:hypothetical protein